MSKGLNGNMTCGNIDTRKRIFWRYFDDQIFLCTLNYEFFLLNILFNKSYSLEVDLSNLSFP
jgi:hypothetical protein